jgi:hypothetical protein
MGFLQPHARYHTRVNERCVVVPCATQQACVAFQALVLNAELFTDFETARGFVVTSMRRIALPGTDVNFTGGLTRANF